MLIDSQRSVTTPNLKIKLNLLKQVKKKKTGSQMKLLRWHMSSEIGVLAKFKLHL